jgi:hypothetical protein
MAARFCKFTMAAAPAYTQYDLLDCLFAFV